MTQDIRRYIKMIDEMYTADNSYLRNYLRNAEFDPYAHWHEIARWAENDDDALEAFSAILGREIESAEDIEDEEPEIFEKLPQHLKDDAKETIYNYLANHDPAELPTHQHMTLWKTNLLHRLTWLVHFSDNADDIANSGFIYGMDNMDRLGLTTYFKQSAKSYGGYNFAFRADSRYAIMAATQNKYGRDAVMFRNSGVLAHHSGDEEEQVIFRGKDVSPKQIVLLRKSSDGEYDVMARSGRRDVLYTGPYQKCASWVTANYDRYRKVLTSR